LYPQVTEHRLLKKLKNSSQKLHLSVTAASQAKKLMHSHQGLLCNYADATQLQLGNVTQDTFLLLPVKIILLQITDVRP